LRFKEGKTTSTEVTLLQDQILWRHVGMLHYMVNVLSTSDAHSNGRLYSHQSH